MTRQFQQQSLNITCAGEALWLHPARVMYWPAQGVLFCADLHAGKEHAFGRMGIAMPGGISEAGVHRLFQLLHLSGAQRLIILGDFMHALPKQSESWLTTLQQQLDSHRDISVEIVAGNHDRRQGQSVVDSRILWHEKQLVLKPFVLQHYPENHDLGYVLCGHLHPVWRLGNNRRGGLRTPAFWFRDQYAVMPAFGEFTGGSVIDADPQTDRVFIAAPQSVLEVPLMKHGRRN